MAELLATDVEAAARVRGAAAHEESIWLVGIVQRRVGDVAAHGQVREGPERRVARLVVGTTGDRRRVLAETAAWHRSIAGELAVRVRAGRVGIPSIVAEGGRGAVAVAGGPVTHAGVPAIRAAVRTAIRAAVRTAIRAAVGIGILGRRSRRARAQPERGTEREGRYQSPHQSVLLSCAWAVATRI